jgi:hypothetical protein
VGEVEGLGEGEAGEVGEAGGDGDGGAVAVAGEVGLDVEVGDEAELEPGSLLARVTGLGGGGAVPSSRGTPRWTMIGPPRRAKLGAATSLP